MAVRVFVSQPLPEPSASELLAGFEVVVGRPGAWECEAPLHLPGSDALVPTPRERVTEALLALAPRLKVVANCAVGTDNVDLDACRRRGVVVTNTPGVLTEATADLTWLLILAVTRRFREGDALIRSGSWDGWKPLELLGTSLDGRTLGVYGMGRIGKAVARRAEAFGMRVVGTVEGDPPEAFERLLAESDVLTIHAPLTPQTRGRFGAPELARMKEGAVLVNTARGPVVDEPSLASALASGHLGGAGLDVFEKEPAVHPGLLGLPNVVLLPHLGSATTESRLGMARTACEEAARVLRGEEPRNRVA
ncbi:MAG: D-glycerate dehydrogenase [Holophagales bacterium]|nr:D-glycerate dehydrogenase [Holophagales bacterium]